MGSNGTLSQPLILILLGILGMLILAIAIILFFVVYQKRLMAQRQGMLQMEMEHQKSLLQQTLEVQEEERKRIAFDLHDEVGSILSTTRIYIHQLSPQQNSKKYDKLKGETTELIDSALDRIRGISHNLFPPNLDRFGLIQATSDFCQRIQSLYTIKVNYKASGDLKLSKKQELAIYRILQELVNNTIKHAQATKIKITYSANEEQVMVYYGDDGVGFKNENVNMLPKGLGINSIESRLNSLNAEFNFLSTPGEGMVLKASIPKEQT